MTSGSGGSIRDLCSACREAAIVLATTSFEARKAAIKAISEEIKAKHADIIAANSEDLKAGVDKIQPAVFSRLTVKESALDDLCDGLDKGLCQIETDPIGRCDFARELAPDLKLYRTSCPIGVICVIYEARPLVSVQLAALTLLTGNGVVLKGGSEAKHSNAMMVQFIRTALKKCGTVPVDSVCFVETRGEVSELLKQDELVDLIVPRGSKELVKNIKASTTIPVLGHADGICHVYVDGSVSSLEDAVRVVMDAKTDYPAACNAAETLLVNRDIAPTFLPALSEAAQSTIEFVCDKESSQYLPGSKTASDGDYFTEWLALKMSVRVVAGVDEAISHINKHGSKHTDVILSNIPENIDKFMLSVDSAGVYCNCSSRFADGWRYGFGAEVGISTNKIHSRGPVGTDGLLIYKYKLFGKGHTQGQMGKKWQYTHKALVVPSRVDSITEVA